MLHAIIYLKYKVNDGKVSWSLNDVQSRPIYDIFAHLT